MDSNVLSSLLYAFPLYYSTSQLQHSFTESGHMTKQIMLQSPQMLLNICTWVMAQKNWHLGALVQLAENTESLHCIIDHQSFLT